MTMSENMIIFVNAKETIVLKNCNVANLVKQLGFENKRIAIEYNENIVVKSTYETTILKEKDKLEIIHAVGGG